MISYHVVIATEKRVSTPDKPRPVAVSVSSGLKTTLDAQGNPVVDTSAQVTSLHSLGTTILDLTNPNILYAASWDGVADHVTVLKGSIAGLNMQFAGWPMTDKPVPAKVLP